MTDPDMFIYCYGLAFGIGKGLMYSTAIQAAISHLPGRKGTVSGFVNCGFGFGGFFFGIIQRKLCNPNDERPIPTETIHGFQNLFGPEVSARVPFMLRSMSIIWISLFVFGLLTVSNYKSELKIEEIKETTKEERETPITKILMTKEFICLYLLAASHKF